MSKKAMSRFRINLVPKESEVNIKTLGEFRQFRLYLKSDVNEDMFDFLSKIIISVPQIEIDEEENRKVNRIYYHKLKTKNGLIRFEINYGGKYKIDKEHPPTISIETIPYIPTKDFLEEIKPVVSLLINKTGFKLFFWDAMKFIKPDELYGRKGTDDKN